MCSCVCSHSGAEELAAPQRTVSEDLDDFFDLPATSPASGSASAAGGDVDTDLDDFMASLDDL